MLLAMLASKEFAVGCVMSYTVAVVAFGFGHVRRIISGKFGRRSRRG
jgi:hypothetical protein